MKSTQSTKSKGWSGWSPSDKQRWLLVVLLGAAFVPCQPLRAASAPDLAAPPAPQASTLDATPTLSDEVKKWEIVCMASDQGAWREVQGIVCDNIPSMPDELRNRLMIDLPASLPSGITAEAKITANLNISFDRAEADASIGSLKKVNAGGRNRLYYYPPHEYNRQQRPVWVGDEIDIDRDAKRSIWLRVRFKHGDKILRERTKEIVLARPVVILVHGINSSPKQWKPWLDFLRSRNIRVPLAAVNHAVWDNGNGSVEQGAQALKTRIREVLENLRTGRAISESNFEYPYNSEYEDLRLAARRVDLIAWSYGGLIARWYISSDGRQPKFDYQGVNPAPAQSVAYNQDVRKFCTLGSMWRGVPLCNYLNEVRFPTPPGHRPFGEAPLIFAARILGLRKLKDVPGYLQKKSLSVHVPSMEVMAVESPWLVYLSKNPFRDYVAYASVAGDDDRYLDLNLSGITYLGAKRLLAPAINASHPKLVNTYGLLDRVQHPKWFAPLSREWLPEPLPNLSDGVVPVWSAAIPGSYQLVGSNHSNYPQNDSTQRYLLQWLHNSSVKTGAVLKSKWKRGVIQSRVLRGDSYVTWRFEPQGMAPTDRWTAYRGGKVGRLSETFLTWQ
jgi:pimeloyl-ACP methyl ester carboxylesterase